MSGRIRIWAAVLATVVVVVGCTSAGSSTAPGSQAAPATAAGTGGLIVVLMPSSTNAYLNQWELGAKEKAKDLGYDIKIVENNFDQAEQDTQVQQALASTDKPVGYVWWPADQKAGLASLKNIAATGVPIVQTNQLPLEGTEAFWTAYAGVDDYTNGFDAADILVKAMKAAGKFPDIGGGVITRFPIGYSAGDGRISGFEAKLKAEGANYTILATDAAGFQESEGYKSASQLIPANKAKNLMWGYGNNDALAIGIIKAAKENGLTPGKDIWISGGTCHGDPTTLVNGELVGTAIQPAFLEGWLSVQVLHKIIQNGGKVQDGKSPDSASLDPATPPADTGMAYKFNFMPNPEIENNQAAFDAAKLWGWTMKQLCEY